MEADMSVQLLDKTRKINKLLQKGDNVEYLQREKKSMR